MICWVARRTQMTRAYAAVNVFLVTMLVILGVPAALGTVAVSSLSSVGQDFLSAAEEIESWFFRPIDIVGFHLQPQQMIEPLQGMASSLLASVPTGSLSIISSVTTNLLWAVTVLITKLSRGW